MTKKFSSLRSVLSPPPIEWLINDKTIILLSSQIVAHLFLFRGVGEKATSQQQCVYVCLPKYWMEYGTLHEDTIEQLSGQGLGNLALGLRLQLEQDPWQSCFLDITGCAARTTHRNIKTLSPGNPTEGWKWIPQTQHLLRSQRLLIDRIQVGRVEVLLVLIILLRLISTFIITAAALFFLVLAWKYFSLVPRLDVISRSCKKKTFHFQHRG